MSDEISVPREFMEQLAALRFPAETDTRMQELVERNYEGRLNKDECAEYESLVELSAAFSFLKMQAQQCLERNP